MEATEDTGNEAPQRRPVLLLVEDDPDQRVLFSRHLADEGYESLAAENGEEALKLFADGKPDLVLLDMMLPDTHGIKVLREIRQQSADVPVIMVSSVDDTPRILEAFDTGADDYITKPVNVPLLFARIRNQLRRTGRRSSTGAGVPAPARSAAKISEFQDGETYTVAFLYVYLKLDRALTASREDSRIAALIERIFDLFTETAARNGGQNWSRKDDACLYAFPAAPEDSAAAVLAAIEILTLTNMYYMLEGLAPDFLSVHAAIDAGQVVYRKDTSSIYNEALNRSAHVARHTSNRKGGGALWISEKVFDESHVKVRRYFRPIFTEDGHAVHEYRFP